MFSQGRQNSQVDSACLSRPAHHPAGERQRPVAAWHGVWAAPAARSAIRSPSHQRQVAQRRVEARKESIRQDGGVVSTESQIGKRMADGG